MVAYKQGLDEGMIRENTPLCFRDIAFKDSLLPILTAYRFDGSFPDITINSQAIIKPKAPVLEAQEQSSMLKAEYIDKSEPRLLGSGRFRSTLLFRSLTVAVRILLITFPLPDGRGSDFVDNFSTP